MNGTKTCTENGCSSPARAREMCTRHYQQWKRTVPAGLPRGPRRSMRQRFWEYADQSEGCWTWTGSKTDLGYGVLPNSEVSTNLAHRIAWIIINGEIPAGQHIDHICHNPSCVNPEHLRVVTPKQNQEHRLGAQSNSKSGVRGVCWNKHAKQWQARVWHNGKAVSAGYWHDLAEAEASVVAKRNELYTHNNADRKLAA